MITKPNLPLSYRRPWWWYIRLLVRESQVLIVIKGLLPKWIVLLAWHGRCKCIRSQWRLKTTWWLMTVINVAGWSKQTLMLLFQRNKCVGIIPLVHSNCIICVIQTCSYFLIKCFLVVFLAASDTWVLCPIETHKLCSLLDRRKGQRRFSQHWKC